MMKTLIGLVAVSIAILSAANGSHIMKCPKSAARALKADEVTISDCPENKCTLHHNTEVSISIKFQTDRDFKELNSDIQGILLGVPLPFPGYYGTSACPHIFDAKGKEKVGCPLEAGKPYVYKNSFKILPIYPKVNNLVIHWGLGDKDGDAVCFQIPARIRA